MNDTACGIVVDVQNERFNTQEYDECMNNTLGAKQSTTSGRSAGKKTNLHRKRQSVLESFQNKIELSKQRATESMKNMTTF